MKRPEDVDPIEWYEERTALWEGAGELALMIFGIVVFVFVAWVFAP